MVRNVGEGMRVDYGDDWETTPEQIRLRFEAGVERIHALRQSIGASAKVGYMPPITVTPAAWTPDGQRLVHAASGAWDAGYGGLQEFGVIVSAGPALCAEEATVRAMLVHEFAHCFQAATVVISHLDLGTSTELLQGDSLDERREEALLADPRDWFGESDCELLRWGDDRIDLMSAEVRALAEAGHLPCTGTPIAVRGRVVVPAEWGAHIRTLRAEREARPQQ